ncbi:MAG: glycosyltransferase family 4 protein [Bacteroidota bacterium]
MIKLVDISFHANNEYANTDELLEAQQASLLYAESIKNKVQLSFIKHITSKGTRIIEKDHFNFFISKNKPGYISSATINHLKKLQPDIIFVHGLIFPLQVIRLRMILGKKCKIVAWHHADRPWKWPKKILQQWADKYITRYLFTSSQNAVEWLDAGIIADEKKINEIPSTLTLFTPQNKEESKRKLHMGAGPNYLWVGRLDKVKDPITVLAGFEKFLFNTPSAKLHMIYQSGELLESVEQRMEQQPELKDNILLHGKVPRQELEVWFSAADFLISGSHREAGSVVVLEAMACGCVPIVTKIPASLKVTGDGEYGLHYDVGNADELAKVLAFSATMAPLAFSKKAVAHFQKEYSVASVARKLFDLCVELTGE